MAAIVAVLGLLLMGMPPSGAGPASGVAPPPALTGGTASAPSTPSVGSAWPMFMGNIEHTSEQLGAMGLNLSSAPKIQMLWNYTTGGDVVGEPAVLNNSVYFGSWDGKEYAVDANNGTLRWATYTGQSQCTVTSGYNGITSSASLARGLVYVGGGGEYWEAISQSNGSIVWNVYTGNNTPGVKGGGHYDWSSPLIQGNDAYIGIASQCDKPLVQGQVLKVDLTTHRVVGIFNTTVPSRLGATVWSSPAMNPASGKIFFATGNFYAGQGNNSTYDDSIVSVNSSTMKIVGHWQIPFNQRVPDGDFGASVTLFTDDHGTPMVGDQDKDGYFFALQQDHLGRGPVWQLKIANNITFSSAAFHHGRLYIGSSITTINNTTYKGSVRSVNATTGHVYWATPMGGTVFGPVISDGDLIIAAGGMELAVLRASTGQVLWNWTAPIRFYGGPSVADGRIYIGDNNGKLYTFGVPLNVWAKATPSSGPHPLKVNFAVHASGGGQGYTYRWTFGDHTTGTSGSPLHTYKKPGNYSVTVRVTDANGAVVTVPLSVTVSERRADRSGAGLFRRPGAPPGE